MCYNIDEARKPCRLFAVDLPGGEQKGIYNMSEYINIIWEIIELLSTVLDCVMITFFVIGMLGFRNIHLKNVKTAGHIAVSCFNSIFISACIGADSVSAANQILICALFSILFLRGSFLYKIYVSALSMFFILIIDSVILTLMSAIFKTPVYILISTSGTLRLAVLFLTKLIYFIVTKFMIRLSRSFTLRLSKAESIYMISFFLMTLIAGSTLFEIISSAHYSVQISAMIFAALILINILDLIIVRKIYKISADSAGKDRTAQEIIKQNEKIKKLLQSYPDISNENIIGNDAAFDTEKSETLNHIILNAQIRCRKKNIIFNYSISPNIHEFPENDVENVISGLLDESISAYNRWEYKPSIDMEILSKNKYMSIIISHYIKGIDAEMLMEDKKSELIPFDPYRNKAVSYTLAKYDGFILRSQKRDKIITNVWLDFSTESNFQKN